MRIAVIGTINKDLILPFGGGPIESYGGILYDIAVLSHLDKGYEVLPVSYIGEDIDMTLRAVLSKMKNVISDGLVTHPDKNHKVILEYTAPGKRNEKSLFQFPPLSWPQVKSVVDSDMIIVNLISGWDIELDTYLKLSKVARDRMYLDVHYLVMGLDKLGRRTLRMPENIDKWLSGSKFIQMNDDEFELLSGNLRNEVDFYQHYLKNDQVLLITRAENGVTVLYDRDGLVGKRQLPAFPVAHVVDATGCGDSFGAGFVTKYLETGDTLTSAKYANLTAAANIMLQGTNEMHRLRDTMEDLKQQTEKEI